MIAEQQVIPHRYEAHGGVAQLFRTTYPDCLLDGPAGTGKSFGTGHYVLWFARKYPGCRIAVVRKTRVSLTESWMVTWEQKVLANGIDRTYLTMPLNQGPSRMTRHAYEFRCGSVLVCAGMDNPTRLFSTEYDLIVVVEATEFSEDEYESLHRALRNNVAPFQRLVSECNPDAEHHWLNQRCIAGLTKRILTRHTDNPSLTPEYLERLSNMTGVRRKRLYEGKWISAEGQIWDNFRRDLHVIDKVPVDANGDSVIQWYFGSCDWGFRNPGCLQVWGVDKERRAYLVHEIYRVGKNPNWWAEQAAKVWKRYGILKFVCDPAEPDNIDIFNRRMRQADGRSIARPANNAFEAGTNIVRERLEPDRIKSQPRLFILSNALESRDPELMEAHKPCGLAEEIPSYVYREIKDGQPVREEAAPDSDDHACDACRYAMFYLDGSHYQPPKRVVKDKRGTIGHFLDMDKDWADINAGKYK